MGEVTALPGYKIPTPRGSPNEDIVGDLEWALDSARSGQLRACAIIYVFDDGTPYPHTSYRYSASYGEGHWLENALMRFVRAFGKWMDAD